MNRTSSAVVLCICAGAAFVLVSGQSLPPTVASHFGMSGSADGFMTRDSYLAATLAVMLVIPLLLLIVVSLLNRIPPRFVNLPNREYFAPERKAETLRFMREHSLRFVVLLVVFLAFVHWMVIEANAVTPPRLPAMPFITALVLFVLAVFVWIGAWLVRFSRPR